MNGKQAKRLRRVAQSVSQGAPRVEYQQNRVKRSIPVTLSPTCTRAMYQALKARWKKAA